jgi:hypothetical protein
MSAKQWRVIYYVIPSIFAVAFLFCAVNRWEKVAWFVVLPIGIISRIVLWKKKNSNRDTTD